MGSSVATFTVGVHPQANNVQAPSKPSWHERMNVAQEIAWRRLAELSGCDLLFRYTVSFASNWLLSLFAVCIR